MTVPRTPAQIYALLLGAGLVAIGVLGLIISSADFDAGTNVSGDDFIIFEVNGWHNLVHIATGALALLVAASRPGARAFALLFGLVYGGVAVWGWIDGQAVADLIPVDLADNVLHTAIAGLGILAGLVSAPGARFAVVTD